ncbi:hypothetical protein AAFC00_002021 [Neodothiora populina]|uniref:Rxt3-domain-containing protein n=1 Tax=Neodothiora populina TaxID=2781224 RepID=A0ABR3PG11_9PEZI
MDRYDQTRYEDRSVAHLTAANHHQQAQQQSQPPPAFTQYNRPPTAQPPVHLPYTDPFHNRDPFMPSTHSRRSSYGPGAGPDSYGHAERTWGSQSSAPPSHHQKQQQQQQQQQQQAAAAASQHQATASSSSSTHPQSAHSAHSAPSNAPSQMSYPYESARRRSVGGAGSPPRFAAGPLDPLPPPPPPPPSFASRTMPPPSPTSANPNSSSFPVPAPRPPPSASPFTASRDMPPYASRSGPSMSISSLIGGDSGRHGNHSPRTNATAPSPTIRPIHPPSPQRARSASTRMEHAQYGRPPSPTTSYAPRSDPRPPTVPPGRTSSDHSQSQSAPSHQHPHPPPPFAQPSVAGFRPYQSSPSSVQGEEMAHNPAHPPPRPNSQPTQQSQAEAEAQRRQDFYERSHYQPSFRSYTEQHERFANPASHHPPPPPPLPPLSHSSERPGPQHEHLANGHSGHQARMSPHPSQAARPPPGANAQDHTRDNYAAALREDQHAGQYRQSFNQYGNRRSPPHAQNGSREELDYRAPRAEMIFGRPVYRHTPPPADAGRYDPASRPPPSSQYPHHMYESHPHDQHARREEGPGGLHHRALLDVSAEMARKNGRSSPLPQAVQGAQPRHIGPTADPGIKNEFGRMFPGLGLGHISSTPTAAMSTNGMATPSRMSPAMLVDPNEHVGTDNEVASNHSRSNKRSRKPRNDVDKVDADEARNDSTPTQHQNKRAKTNHPPHHHHHHAHHHHHHHRPEEQSLSAPSPFNTIRFPANPSAPTAAAHHHHHHHHAVHAHVPPHHHHHTPKPMPSPPRAEITVSNQAVLSNISQRPRKHLGYELYKTRLGLPPRDSTPLDTKLHFKSQMRPIPFFEDKENCTFTIRVPRGYLKAITTPQDEQFAVAGGLEEICKTRAVWGTEIYTDDSDVVAAAVHSGWLRGDFGDYNADIVDLFAEDGESTFAPVGALISAKPEIPLRPADDADLHITVLLAPPLSKYAATTQHHLRSREWGSDHDGMSFMIHSMQFVREGKASRYAERTAAARHQRIAEDLKRRDEAAETLVGLLRGSRDGRGENKSVSVSAY